MESCRLQPRVQDIAFVRRAQMRSHPPVLYLGRKSLNEFVAKQCTALSRKAPIDEIVPDIDEHVSLALRPVDWARECVVCSCEFGEYLYQQLAIRWGQFVPLKRLGSVGAHCVYHRLLLVTAQKIEGATKMLQGITPNV